MTIQFGYEKPKVLGPPLSLYQPPGNQDHADPGECICPLIHPAICFEKSGPHGIPDRLFFMDRADDQFSWFLLPALVYRRAVTFKHSFSMDFDEAGFTLRHDRGQKNWGWSALSHYVESPHFFHLYYDTRSLHGTQKRLPGFG